MVLRENFWLESDGIPLASAIFTPDGPGPHLGLVICHGMPAGPRPAPGASAPADEDPGYPALAERCARQGFATLIFNFRGSGESGGNFHSLGWARDLEAALSWMRGVPDVDGARIALLGSSLGAAVAIYVAAHRPEVAGLAAYASPATMGMRPQPAEAVARLRELGDIRDHHFPPSLEAWSQEHTELSPREWIGQIAPRPLLLLHGEADDVVSPQNSRALFERAGEPKDLRLLPGAGHRSRHEERAITEALEWLKEKLLP